MAISVVNQWFTKLFQEVVKFMLDDVTNLTYFLFLLWNSENRED